MKIWEKLLKVLRQVIKPKKSMLTQVYRWLNMCAKQFYCPLYNGEISQYDCDELCLGVNFNKFVNDGLPPLMSIEYIREKREICIRCQVRQNTNYSAWGKICRWYWGYRNNSTNKDWYCLCWTQNQRRQLWRSNTKSACYESWKAFANVALKGDYIWITMKQ